MFDCLHKHTCLLCSLPPPFVVHSPSALPNSDSIIYRMFFSVTQGLSSASNLHLFCMTKLGLSENYSEERLLLFQSFVPTLIKIICNCHHSTKIFKFDLQCAVEQKMMGCRFSFWATSGHNLSFWRVMFRPVLLYWKHRQYYYNNHYLYVWSCTNK